MLQPLRPNLGRAAIQALQEREPLPSIPVKADMNQGGPGSGLRISPNSAFNETPDPNDYTGEVIGSFRRATLALNL